jgi:hypothetical protein
MFQQTGAIMGKVTTTRQSKRRGEWRKLQRGQSLMEFALSVTILILVFSGIIDLGRAFFTRITLESAISEGAHWMAAYPGCALYGGAFGDASNVVKAPPACVGTNSIIQRIKNESNLLAPINVKKVELRIPPGSPVSRFDQIQPGHTLLVYIEYEMTVLTPVIKGLFGDVWVLSSTAEEVVRGTNLPDTKGKASTYTPISPVPMVGTDLAQNSVPSGPGDNRCENGFPPLYWTVPVGVTGGFEVVLINAGTGLPLTPGAGDLWTNPVIETKSAASSPVTSWVKNASLNRQIAINVGGNQMYGVRSYNVGGSPPANQYSDYRYILTTCPKVQPIPESAVCDTVSSPPASVTLKWTMPKKHYDWEVENVNVDAAVAGYRLWRYDPLTSTETLVTNIAGRDTTQHTLTFVDPNPSAVPPVLDPNRTGQYRLQAYDSSNTLIGVKSDSVLDLDVACN